MLHLSCPYELCRLITIQRAESKFQRLCSFSVGCKRRICPSAGCASAPNAIGSDTDIYIYSGICV